jgi:hypothetical protein
MVFVLAKSFNLDDRKSLSHKKFSSLFNPEPYEGLGFNFSFAELLPAAKIQFLIGDIGYLFSSDVGYFYELSHK